MVTSTTYMSHKEMNMVNEHDWFHVRQSDMTLKTCFSYINIFVPDHMHGVKTLSLPLFT